VETGPNDSHRDSIDVMAHLAVQPAVCAVCLPVAGSNTARVCTSASRSGIISDPASWAQAAYHFTFLILHGSHELCFLFLLLFGLPPAPVGPEVGSSPGPGGLTSRWPGPAPVTLGRLEGEGMKSEWSDSKAGDGETERPKSGSKSDILAS